MGLQWLPEGIAAWWDSSSGWFHPNAETRPREVVLECDLRGVGYGFGDAKSGASGVNHSLCRKAHLDPSFLSPFEIISFFAALALSLS